jgi:hypothetical protein
MKPKFSDRLTVPLAHSPQLGDILGDLIYGFHLSKENTEISFS